MRWEILRNSAQDYGIGGDSSFEIGYNGQGYVDEGSKRKNCRCRLAFDFPREAMSNNIYFPFCDERKSENDVFFRNPIQLETFHPQVGASDVFE